MPIPNKQSVMVTMKEIKYKHQQSSHYAKKINYDRLIEQIKKLNDYLDAENKKMYDIIVEQLSNEKLPSATFLLEHSDSMKDFIDTLKYHIPKRVLYLYRGVSKSIDEYLDSYEDAYVL